MHQGKCDNFDYDNRYSNIVYYYYYLYIYRSDQINNKKYLSMILYTDVFSDIMAQFDCLDRL